MDKNTITGFVLIVLIVIGYGVLSKPNKEELARRQHYNDSVAAVQQLAQKQQAAQSKNGHVAHSQRLDRIESTKRHNSKKHRKCLRCFCSCRYRCREIIYTRKQLSETDHLVKRGAVVLGST